ncbi:MAG: hypothetical protein IKO57_11675 [Treponema sp.]|nr:hypothetical protein [Treponema sp.]
MANVEFYEQMMETSGDGVLTSKTLSHREAVLPFLRSGSRRELVSNLYDLH